VSTPVHAALLQEEEFERECERCTERAKAAMGLRGGEGRARREQRDRATQGGKDKGKDKDKGKGKGQFKPPLPTCRVTRRIVCVPRVLVLHLKRFSVQAVGAAEERDSAPAKENRSSDGDTESYATAEAMDTGPADKAAPVYNFRKKQERVTIPRVLAIGTCVSPATLLPAPLSSCVSPKRWPGYQALWLCPEQ